MQNAPAISRNKKKRFSGQEIIFILIGVLVPLAFFLLLYVYVNFSSFLMAFQKPKEGKLIWTFDNFEWVFKRIANGSQTPEDNLQLAFINTFITFLVQMVVFLGGIFVAYGIYKKVLGYKTFRVLLYLPSILSSVVTCLFYLELMNSRGWSEFLISVFHLEATFKNPLVDSRFSNAMVLLNYVWLNIPANMILWGGAFSRIPSSVLESARIDGCGWFRELFQIVLPMIWPTMVVLLTTNIASIFGATGNVFLLTSGAYGTQTVSNWMYMQVQQASSDMSGSLYRVSALGLLLTVISCTLAILIRHFLNKKYAGVDM